MSIIAAATLAILLGLAGVAILRKRRAESAILNERLEDACHTSLISRVDVYCAKAR